VEGSLIYAYSRQLREYLNAHGSATFTLDLAPGRDAARVLAEVSHPRGARSLSSHLQSRVGISGIKTALLHEVLTKEKLADAATLAETIKALPITVRATRPVAEAISTAGGVRFEGLDQNLMLTGLPGVFVAGEMLDWEAPTGGYLLTACFATGLCAGMGVREWLKRSHPE
jgi:predicted flavoprotein YhiN